MDETPNHLLAPNDPAPVTVYNENGSSPFLIVADDAGNSMPCGLGRLGVPESEWERHIAWNIGIAGVCRFMAAELDAAVVLQNYSRLVSTATGCPGRRRRFRTSASLPRSRETCA